MVGPSYDIVLWSLVVIVYDCVGELILLVLLFCRLGSVWWLSVVPVLVVMRDSDAVVAPLSVVVVVLVSATLVVPLSLPVVIVSVEVLPSL